MFTHRLTFRDRDFSRVRWGMMLSFDEWLKSKNGIVDCHSDSTNEFVNIYVKLRTADLMETGLPMGAVYSAIQIECLSTGKMLKDRNPSA